MQIEMLDRLPAQITRLRHHLREAKTMAELEVEAGCSHEDAFAFLNILSKFDLVQQRQIGEQTYYAVGPKALQRKADAEAVAPISG